MASLVARTSCIHNYNPLLIHPFSPVFQFGGTSTISLSYHISNHTLSSSAHNHPSFYGSQTNLHRTIRRCHPGPPPGEEPPSSSSSGVIATVSRLWDKLQIFFAVFLWMSLFFWGASTTGGSKNDRRNKGGRFRK